MKLLLKIFCWILAAFCIYFPFSYKHSYADLKEYRISHILVNTKEEAEEIKQNIQDRKKTFEDSAKEYSKCESAIAKGDIGYSPKGMLYKNIENTAINLKRGEISEPIQSEYGWHLIKLTGIKYFSDGDEKLKVE